MSKRMFSILVKASRMVIVDADDASEAQRLAMDNCEFDAYHIDEATTDAADINAEEVAQYLRHGAYDFREKP